MKKSSHHSKNSTAKLYMPIGGMCNTISGEYIKDNQASSISGVIYNEENNTFQGSPVYEIVPSFSGRKFERLFNVEYNGKNALFGTYSGGIANITDNKDYAVESNITPTDIIYNQDGLYISSSTNVYHLNNSGEISKITFSFTPYMWQRISTRLSTHTLANSVFYYGNKIYFSDNRGTGYMSPDGKEIKILNPDLKLLEFHICGSTLFAVDFYDIYTISGDEISLYLNIAYLGLRVKISAVLGYKLLILNYETKYEIIEINTLNQAVTRYPVSTLKGLGTYGEKHLRVVNNQIYMLINETDETFSSIKSSLYKLRFSVNQYLVDSVLFLNFTSNNCLLDIFYIGSKLFCYYTLYNSASNNVQFMELYEYNNGSLVYLNFSNKPANITSAIQIAVNGNRVYASNTYGIYYIDILPSNEYIPCLLVQNGRLIVPQGSSLYFSGAGDFFNWSWNTDSDALFIEIGYKEGGRIIYAALVLDSIIVFKDNGSIYRLSGSYPNWTVSKLGEIDKLTTRAIVYGSEIIFGSLCAVKKIGVTEYYGDFFLSDYQQNLHDKNMQDVSLSLERNTIVFINDEYIFEYNNILKGFSIYQHNTDKLIQIIEIYNSDNTYSSYGLGENGLLYKADRNKLNDINVKYKEIKSNQNILVKAITIYTKELLQDETFTLNLGEYSNNFILKAGKTYHKYFITKRLNKLQAEISHNGRFFIDNIFIEYSTIGE